MPFFSSEFFPPASGLPPTHQTIVWDTGGVPSWMLGTRGSLQVRTAVSRSTMSSNACRPVADGAVKKWKKMSAPLVIAILSAERPESKLCTSICLRRSGRSQNCVHQFACSLICFRQLSILACRVRLDSSGTFLDKEC